MRNVVSRESRAAPVRLSPIEIAKRPDRRPRTSAEKIRALNGAKTGPKETRPRTAQLKRRLDQNRATEGTSATMIAIALPPGRVQRLLGKYRGQHYSRKRAQIHRSSSRSGPLLAPTVSISACRSAPPSLAQSASFRFRARSCRSSRAGVGTTTSWSASRL